MKSIKISQIKETEAIGDNDLLEISKFKGEASYESARISGKTLKEALGGGGSLQFEVLEEVEE